MSIKKPMKAPSKPLKDDELYLLPYPVVGSPKLDGFRCIVDGEPKTSSMKIWPNLFTKDYLSKDIFHGLDGELLVGNPCDPKAFHNTSGALRRIQGHPDFRYYVFDNWVLGSISYKSRWIDKLDLIIQDPRIVVLSQTILSSPEEVISYENEMLNLGYEGAMIRSLTSQYKDNRCSFRDLNIFKRKPFVECEAEIIKIIEGTHNTNEATINETGNMRRSSHQAGMVPNNTFGAFILFSKLWNTTFRSGLGIGYDAIKKQEIWDNRDQYIGQIATVKYQKYGSIDAPRIPNVIKIRPTWDLG